MASGKKRRKGAQGRKPRGAQHVAHGAEMGSVGERDATQKWAAEAVIDIGKPAPLGESRTAIAGEPEPVGYSNEDTVLAGGSVIPAGSPVYRVPDDQVPAAVAAARDAGYEPVTGDEPGPTRDKTDWQPGFTHHAQGGGGGRRRIPVVPPHLQQPAEPRLEPAGDAGMRERLEQVSPGLAEKLAQGLGKDELGEMAPQIAAALSQAGARPGTYTFTGSGEPPAPGEKLPPGWKLHDDKPGPSLIVTPDINAIPEGSADLVIEDLDPEMDDEGRVLIGSERQVRAYHDKVRELDARTRKFTAGPGNPPATQIEAEAIRVQTTWNADSVMDQLAWLIYHYRRPSEDICDYLAFHMRDSQGQDARASRHFWPIDLTRGPADIPEGRELAQLLARGLGEADAYQVTTVMCRRMRDMFDANRDHIPLRLSEGEMPAPAGFAWLDQPWLLHLGAGYWLPTRAVSWDTTARPVRDPDTGQSRWVDCVRVVQWLLLADDVAFRRWEGERDRADRVANQIGRLVPHSVEVLPFDTEFNITPKFRDQGVQSLGLFHILWMYLGMELPKSRPVLPSSPAVRKRVNRTLKHKRVHIITLRKIAYISDPVPHFPRKINWTCRWPVEKHHRHIDPYTDEDRDGRQRKHKATPAGRVGLVLDDDHDVCGVCLANGQTVRITEVHLFWKGPTNMPIRTPAKERTLKRLSR
jgi:hypothetical protein